MKKVTDDDFETEVLDNEKPVLVDFYTEWCGPCRMMSPLLDQLSAELDTVNFVKFDSDQGETPDTYGITSLPTFVLFVDGEEVARRTGAAAKPELQRWIESRT
jgi:thioredoxin 1